MSRIQCDGNFLIDRTVTLDCHRKKRNLSIGWIDIKMGQDSIDHGWLEEIMLLHSFPPGCVVLSEICREAGIVE